MSVRMETGNTEKRTSVSHCVLNQKIAFPFSQRYHVAEKRDLSKMYSFHPIKSHQYMSFSESGYDLKWKRNGTMRTAT